MEGVNSTVVWKTDVFGAVIAVWYYSHWYITCVLSPYVILLSGLNADCNTEVGKA